MPAARGRLNTVNSDVLIFVEGVASAKSDGTEVPHGDAATDPNWGENFYGFSERPLDIPKERLVLSPHTYGPSVFVQNHFLDPNQEGCEELAGDEAGNADCYIVIDAARIRPGWEEHFGYLRDQGYAMVVGEIGGIWTGPTSYLPGKDRIQRILRDFCLVSSGAIGAAISLAFRLMSCQRLSGFTQQSNGSF